MKNIEEHEAMLRKYAVEKMKELDNIEIYNENGVGAIAFNIKMFFLKMEHLYLIRMELPFVLVNTVQKY